MGGNKHLTHLRAGPQDDPPWNWPKSVSGVKGLDVSMETSEHGVLVEVGSERYLVPWAQVQTVRLEDAPPPMVPGIPPEQFSRMVSPELAATASAIATTPKRGGKSR